MSKAKKTILGRWDKDVIKEAKEVMPKESTATISRLLWEQSRYKKDFLRKSKKGSIQDVTFVIVAILTIAMVTLIGFKISTLWNDEVQSSTIFGADAKAATDSLNDNFTGTIDNMFMVAVVFLCLGSIILAALVRIHPVFLPVFLFALVILIFFAGIASNIYTEIATTPAFAVEATSLTVISFVMTKLPIISAVFGVLLAIVSYKTWRAEQLL